MKTMLFLLLSGFLSNVCGQQMPANPEQYFDFWVGKWEASWDEGDGKKGRGTNTITKVLDEKVIHENFVITEGQSKGFKGTSISVYQPQLDEWKQSWADNNGGFYAFKGKFDGTKRIFQTDISNTKDGKKLIQRMVFYDITGSTMTWDWEASNDGGQTWNLNWRIHYERIN